MTISIQLHDLVEAKTTLADRNPAFTLDFIGSDSGGWAKWHVREGGTIKPVGTVFESPEGAVLMRLHSPLP